MSVAAFAGSFQLNEIEEDGQFVVDLEKKTSVLSRPRQYCSQQMPLTQVVWMLSTMLK